ncbi:MAG: hypothetical protein S4CHLAM37_12220 [Chlamydiia bacterium]|nr:hypothetical protein [Chlamydiia bacterium]
MKVRTFLLITALFLTSLCFCTQNVTIALVFDGAEADDYHYPEGIQYEINDLLEDEFEITYKFFADDWNLQGARSALMSAYQDKEVDLVLTLGILNTYEALKIVNYKKPTIIGYDTRIFDYSLAEDEEFSFKQSDYLAYFKGKRTLSKELAAFKDVTKASSVTVVGDASLIGLEDFSLIRDIISFAAEEAEQKCSFISVESNEIETLKQIKDADAESILFLPTWRLSKEQLQTLITAVNTLKIPTYSVIGESQVEEGMLMTLAPLSEIKRIARRIALNVQELLLTDSSDDIETNFFHAQELIINETTAHNIDLDISWNFLRGATLVKRVPEEEHKRLTLNQAVRIAIENNLDLEAERYRVRAGRFEVLKALSILMPQLNTRAFGRYTDKNSAEFSFGRNPQRLLRGEMTLDQMIYDEDTASKFSIEKKEQRAREFNKNTFELDIVLDTTIAYLSILRIQAEKQIAEENLALTNANLKRAHELVESGQARLSEVYRWQSEQATNHETLVSIQATLDNTKTEFNRILNRDLQESVILEDIDPLSADFVIDFGNLEPFIQTKGKYTLYKTYMADLAKKQSPEIQSLDQQVLAQSRQLLATSRAFYLPKFSLFGNMNKNMAKGGAGKDSVIPGVSNTAMEGAIGINVTYPIFTSGGRRADKNKALNDLSKVKTKRASLIDKVEKNVIQAIDNMKASYEGIFFASKSVEAGEKNLVIVQNSYARGVVSIVDLIDAQNTAIVAKQAHANTVYDYLIDFMEFQRSLGKFDFSLSEGEKNTIRQQFLKYLFEKDKATSSK